MTEKTRVAHLELLTFRRHAVQYFDISEKDANKLGMHFFITDVTRPDGKNLAGCKEAWDQLSQQGKFGEAALDPEMLAYCFGDGI